MVLKNVSDFIRTCDDISDRLIQYDLFFNVILLYRRKFEQVEIRFVGL